MPKPQAKIGTMLDLLQKNPEATQADLAELEAATQPRRPPVIRASTLSERIRDKYYDLFESAARQPIGRLADALGLSDLQGIANERATGGKLVMASAVPPPGESKIATKAAQTAKGFTVWHGSPHDFPPVRHIRMPDGTELFQNMSELAKTPKGATVLEEFPLGRFDLSKIGTGEGAQAYGHGLYMAEAPDVARGYRDQVPVAERVGGVLDTNMRVGGKPVTDLYSALENRAVRLPIKQAQAEYDKLSVLEDLMHQGDALGVRERGTHSPEAMAWFERDIVPKFTRRGKLYEVNIKADPESFLDWDKPLSQQSEKVRNAGASVFNDPRRVQAGFAGGFDPNAITGADLVHASEATWRGGKRGATEALNQAGIPGIKYLDQDSRTAGEGTRNWVVWDTSVIKILGKLGIAAAALDGLQQQAIANGGKVRADDVHALIQSGSN